MSARPEDMQAKQSEKPSVFTSCIDCPCTHTGVEPDRIEIERFGRGSVIVDFCILPVEHNVADSRLVLPLCVSAHSAERGVHAHTRVHRACACERGRGMGRVSGVRDRLNRMREWERGWYVSADACM